MYNNYNNKPGLAWKRYVCTCLFLLIGFSSLADKLGFYFINNKKQTKLSFTLINNLIVIPVKVNDGIDVNLVLDTGGRSLILFGRKFQKALEVLPDKEIRLTGYGNKAFRPAKLSINNKVSVADVEGKGLGIILTDNKYFFPYAQGLPVHGIIGYQIFSRFVVKIDYPNGEIILSEPTEYLDSDEFHVVNLVVKDTKPYIKASCAKAFIKTDAFFHIDTGSAREIILFVTDQNKKEAHKYFKGKHKIGKGLNGQIYGYKGDYLNLSLKGNNEFKNIYPYFIEREFSDREITDAAGSIGSGFFKNFVIIFDYINQKFYYKRMVT